MTSGTASVLLRSAVALLLAAAILAVHLSPLREWVAVRSLERARHEIAELGALAPLAFVASCVLGIGLGLPRLGFAALGGVSFGWLAGCALAQLGTVGGCFVAFSWSRYLGRELAVRRGGRVWQGLRERVARHPIATNAVLRLIPIGNSFAQNTFLGVCPVSSRDFLLGTALGTFPETLAFALFGAGAAGGSRLAIGVGTALVAALAIGSVALLRSRRIGTEAP
jgi:uncharacterized membrane protein YdjX (TVP38/TMEM64 family)